LYAGGTSVTIVGSVFTGNRADYTTGGGGAAMVGTDASVFTNCTVFGNQAEITGGIMNTVSGTPVVLTNCILWNNLQQIVFLGVVSQYSQLFGDATANHCCIEGIFTDLGDDNFGDDPRFVDANGADERVGTEDDDFRLLTISRCIDHGDNAAVPVGVTTDLAGNARFFDFPGAPDIGGQTPPVVDIGAYEFTTTGADCNGNGVPDDVDIASGQWPDADGNGIPDACDAWAVIGDLNGDGLADGLDIQVLVSILLALP